MRTLILATCLFSGIAVSAADPWLVFEGKEGPGKGKQVVLISGDEEYRSEEALPMLGRLLAERHGFTCSVLLPINKESGEIDPTEQTNVPGLHLLEKADFVVLGLRFREWPDAEMKYFVDYVEAGKPLLGLRTSTHAFDYRRDRESPHAKWTHDSRDWPGGFGKQVLGETWVNHHGNHGGESTRGVVEEANRDHPLLRGVEDVWGPSDVYGIRELPEDATVLLRGQVIAGMNPDDKPVEGAKNDPMMPLSWVRDRKVGDVSQKVVVTTMGAATDLESEGLRRFVVNSVFWGCGLEVPEKADVTPVGDYQPTDFGFNTFKKGVKPDDLR